MFRGAVRRVATPGFAPAGEAVTSATAGEVIDATAAGGVTVKVEVEDDGDHVSVALAPPSGDQARSDQEEEDCMEILMNAVHRRKLLIRALRDSDSAADRHAPPVPPVQQPSPPTPAHRALEKRLAAGPPPGFTGVRQPPQKQHHAHPPQKQNHQLARQHGPPPVAPTARRAAPAAAGAPRTAPVAATSSRKPPLHTRPTAPRPAAALMCGVCNVPCMSAFNLAQHEKGKRHRNKVAGAAGEINVQCEVCDVYLSGEINVREHYAGKRHLRQVFLSGLSGKTGAAEQPRWLR